MRSLRLLIFAGLAVPALAGGGPQHVLVVINDDSIESQEAGKYYQLLRGIPDRNVCRISVPPLEPTLSESAFQTAVLDRVSAHIEEQGLEQQIDYVVLSKEIPYRVGSTNPAGVRNGASSVVFYGFKTYGSFCSVEPGTENPYFRSERAFRSADLYGGTNLYLTTLLTGTTLTNVQGVIERAVAADGTDPGGKVYLIKPAGDPARNIRYQRFDDYSFASRFQPWAPTELRFTFEPSNQSDVMGYVTGSANPPHAEGYTYLPGAIGDHLTSVGGALLEATGQMSILRLLQAGMAGSYGTVTEPCAQLEKFPDPRVHFWYARGFNLAESYYMSVENPYQGVVAGDPLTAPFALPPDVSISNPLPHACVSGVVTVEVNTAPGARGHLNHAIELFVDDRFLTNGASAGPTPGNLLEVTFPSNTCTYEVSGGDTLYDAVEGLALAVNASNLEVRAVAQGDRLLLVYTNFGSRGSSITYSATATLGTADTCTVYAGALSSNFLESTYVAREFLALGDRARNGDEVSCTITLTNGTSVVVSVVATNNESSPSVMERLQDAINAEPLLAGPDGVLADNLQPSQAGNTFATLSLDARTPGPEGFNLFVDYEINLAPPPTGLDDSYAFSDHFNDNGQVLTARGTVLFERGRSNLAAACAWDTTGRPNGPHRLMAVVRGGAGTELQARHEVTVVVSNTPLTCSLAAPSNGMLYSLGDTGLVEAVVDQPAGTVTQVAFYVEGRRAGVLTAPPYTSSWNTLDIGVGEVTVAARAWDSSGASAVSGPSRVRVVRSFTLDTDGDGLADSWEQDRFGTLYSSAGAGDDPDADGQDNRTEFVVDTDPLVSNEPFRLTGEASVMDDTVLTFPASTMRVYQVEVADPIVRGLLSSSTSTAFSVESTSPSWVDDGSVTGVSPNLSTTRLYRVRVSLP